MSREDLEKKEKVKKIKSFVNGAIHGWVKCSLGYLKILLASCNEYGLTKETEDIKDLIKKLKGKRK